MRKPIKNLFALAGMASAVTVVGLMSAPVTTSAFTTIGGSLGTGQRDFRVFNNFADTGANNNVTPHANFPGQTGAVMALWKGQVEWASVSYAGDGLGDGAASNPNLGDGGANFDNMFQHLHTAAGGNNGNVHSAETGGFCGGSTLAYTLTPISDGWTIRYCEVWNWKDGPGAVSSGVDIQGVACHEIGHSLGLGHTGVSGATMRAFITGTGTGQRSIEADDIAGVQFIYGVVSGSKPEITSIGGVFAVGSTLTITGQNFSTSGNDVWFTNPGGGGAALKVTGVSSTGGGTVIAVTIPSGADDGEVMVQKNATGHSSLSNAWPLDIGGAPSGPPTVVSVNPSSVWTGGWQPVTVTGQFFIGTTSVTFGGTNALSYTIDTDTQITAVSPPGTLFSTVDLTVTNGLGTDTLPNAITYTTNPAVSIDTVSPDNGLVQGGTEVTISGPSVVGVTEARFGGVAGANMQITSATSLTVETPASTAGTVDVEVIGDTSDILPGAYTFVDQGQFVDLGPGGAGGFFGEPVLTGTGDLSPGGAGFTLDMVGAFPVAAGAMFVALTEGALPFKGGIFYPVPVLVSIPITADALGSLSLAGAFDNTVPSGTQIVLQDWFLDITAPEGVSATNGLRLDIP